MENHLQIYIIYIRSTAVTIHRFFWWYLKITSAAIWFTTFVLLCKWTHVKNGQNIRIKLSFILIRLWFNASKCFSRNQNKKYRNKIKYRALNIFLLVKFEHFVRNEKKICCKLPWKCVNSDIIPFISIWIPPKSNTEPQQETGELNDEKQLFYFYFLIEMVVSRWFVALRALLFF